MPTFICYDQERCDFHPTIYIYDLTCQSSSEMGFSSNIIYREWYSFVLALKKRFHSCTRPIYSIDNQTHKTLYQCTNSKKFISKHRLIDGISDCIENDDELYNVSCTLNHTYRRLCPNENKCLSPILSHSICSMYTTNENRILSIPFQMICNNIPQMIPLLIDGRIESDETDCGEQWPCSNMYTRCNHSWACENRSDETGCFHSTCSSFEHDCVSPINLTMICLSMNRTNDGIIDCLGATDEMNICRNKHPNQLQGFHCANSDQCVSFLSMCNEQNNCVEENGDEVFCKGYREGPSCFQYNTYNITREEQFLCNINRSFNPIVHYFKLTSSSSSSSTTNIQNKQGVIYPILNRPEESLWALKCNRGLHLRQSIGDNQFFRICLCPPSYYGNECRYQNQRVSLTLSVLTEDLNTIYILLVMLINNDKDKQEIHSYEEIIHKSQYDCPIKYNIYLLYSSRPKVISNNYSIRIDVFTPRKNSIDYHASWNLPIPFIFLPVNRLATQINVPIKKNICKNGGTYIPINDDNSNNNFQCICTEYFTGPTCEQSRRKLEISLGDIDQSSHIFIHLITVNSKAQLTRTTIVKKISIDQRYVSFNLTIEFHLVFIEVNNDYYYLIYSSLNNNLSIIKRIHSSDRCPSYEELFNLTMINWHPLRRVKYYHDVCNKYKELNCYFDESLMCLCTNEYHANCFNLKRYKSYLCRRNDYCMNNGKCFQDKPICPSTLICICSNCYYGDRCQYYAEGFSLSLDAIFNFEIKRYISFINQPSMVTICAILTMIMFILGFLNGSLSIITFYDKKLREVGCGIYLLGTSIISLLIMSVFALNFWLLFIAQSNLVINRSFLLVRCITIESLLKILFSITNWLNACVAAERSLTIHQGIHFNKEKSKRIAKKIFLFLIIFSIGSNIHESIHHQLLDDIEEERTWCQVRYSSIIAEKQIKIKNKYTLNQLLYIQFQIHKHLISPIVLMSLAIPRLISSFTTGCVKSTRNPWLFILGYYISYVPSMLTFIIYIIPSDLFKKEFYQTIRRIQQQLSRQ
ncbi:unnamed protein product [Rotaria sordida]|uniref:EGF-like domain-containing protein n=1 Tax=Rotaria sordida TaxID=392033 RepID=A0A818Q7F9_9BILA|nr:unnamed protein product [Rotaria sordida]